MKPKILIIPDKFKFTYNARKVAEMIANSLKNQGFSNIELIPVSDGGDGFLDTINSGVNLQFIEHEAVNARFEKIDTTFGIYKKTAFIESAKTIGLEQLKYYQRKTILTTSFGLGNQINEALKYKPEKIIIGLGGSSSTDAGIGMAQALGLKFFDCKNNQLKPIGLNLTKICKIKGVKLLQNVNIIGLSDVENTLYGKNGASFSFARQKNASYAQIVDLDKGLEHIKKLFIEQFGYSFLDEKYEGAAGGLGFGIKYFLKGKLSSGSKYIFNLLDIESKIKEADIVITGEGKFDKFSLNGKIVGEIYKLNKKYNKKTIVICGFSEDNIVKEDLIIIPLSNKKIKVIEAKKNTPKAIHQLDFKKILINYF